MTIKAFLHRQWGEEPVEIRRFTIDQDVTTSYAYLLEKISQVFPSLRPDNVIVTWIGELEFHTLLAITTLYFCHF